MDLSEPRLKELDCLQSQTRYKFLDIKLLNKALTHKSYANEKNKKLKHNEQWSFWVIRFWIFW